MLLLLSLVDTADDTSRGRTQNDASISGPNEDDAAGGSVAVATDITAGESAVTADGAADDTHASACTTGVDVEAVATSPVAAARKRKGRGKGSNVARDERKRQRRAAFLPDGGATKSITAR